MLVDLRILPALFDTIVADQKTSATFIYIFYHLMQKTT
jgi:hypothetical protein